MDCLSEELLLFILEFLPICFIKRDRIYTVCSLWNRLIQDNLIRTSVSKLFRKSKIEHKLTCVFDTWLEIASISPIVANCNLSSERSRDVQHISVSLSHKSLECIKKYAPRKDGRYYWTFTFSSQPIFGNHCLPLRVEESPHQNDE